MDLSVFKLIVNQLFDMYGFNFSRLSQAQIYNFSRLLAVLDCIMLNIKCF